MTDTTVSESNGHSQDVALSGAERGQYVETLTLLQERIAELELSLEDTGWMRMTVAGEREFSREGLRKLQRIARLSFLKNPLINHAVRIQANYVWGQGAQISATNDDVNDLVQKFLDDRRNKLEFSGHQARILKEIELQIHGNLFFALFTNPHTGRVIVKNVYTDEIVDIICDPDDASRPMFYKRQWSQMEFNAEQGEMSPYETKYAYYPDWQTMYDSEAERPSMIGDWPVMWDAPIYHVRVGGFSDQRFGIPEIYSALDWARAVKDDLSDYATIRRALSRFAWNMSVKGGPAGVKAAKAKINTTLNADGAGLPETNPPPVTASTFIGTAGVELSPIKTSGATISPDEGRRLWLMVSAGTGIPETMLSGDADVGNLATSKTLDRPTELQMRNRQTLWADIYSDILNYVIDQAVLASNGPLKGTQDVDPYTDEVIVTLAEDETGEPADRSLDIEFPNVLQQDILPHVQAIVAAVTLSGQANAGLIDDRTASKLLLSALGADNIDEMLQELFPENFMTTLAGRDLPDDTTSNDGGDPNNGIPPTPPGTFNAGPPQPPTPPQPAQPGSAPPAGHGSPFGGSESNNGPHVHPKDRTKLVEHIKTRHGGLYESLTGAAPRQVIAAHSRAHATTARNMPPPEFREALFDLRKMLSGMTVLTSDAPETTETKFTYDDAGRVTSVQESTKRIS